MSTSETSAIPKMPLQYALDRIVDGFVLLDHEDRILYMNPAAERISHTRAEDALGLTVWEVWPGASGTEIETFYRAATSTATAQHFEHRYLREGRERWMDVHVFPSEIGLAVYFLDITERKHKEAAAARVERAYKAALSNTPDLVYVFDLNHRFTYANEALLRMWGRSWDDAIGKNCLELGYPDWHAAMHDREIEQVIATRAPIRGVVPFTGTHGRRFYDYIFVPVLGESGEVEAIAGTTRDVTERYQAEQILRASEERLRLAQQCAQLATWEWDAAGGDITWAQESAQLFGRPVEELTTMKACLAAVHPDDRKAAASKWRRAVEENGEYAYEFRVIWPDGSVHWLQGRGKSIPSADGNSARLLGVVFETTAQREAEEILRQEKILLARLFDQAPAFMAWMSGPGHVVQMVNPLYRELVGNRDLIGRPIGEAIPETEPQGFISILDQVYRTGKPYRAVAAPIDIARHPGEPLERRFLTFVYQPLCEADGAISGVIALGVDVTDTVRAEEALRQNEKLAAVGRLAASIAHEINNPLEAITNLLFLLQCDGTISEACRHLIELAQGELNRVSHITTQTLRFYRQNTKPSRIDTATILDSVANLYERRLQNAEIRLERRDKASAPVMVHEGELRQILANLVGNALEATPPKGCIVLRQRAATDWRNRRKGVVFTVADNGRGMSRDVLRRIFEPFFSTKGETGTGLGLWISQGIAEKHGGWIRVRSSNRSPLTGTIFRVFAADLEHMNAEHAAAAADIEPEPAAGE